MNLTKIVSAAALVVAGLSVPLAASASVSCHAINGGISTKTLPDRGCTPGVTNGAVTQADIGSTICRSGWTATVRPPESYTNRLKVVQIAEYHYANRSTHVYEEDHLIPLELGGSPASVKNLWPEYDAGHIPNPKDAVENTLNHAVCSHRVSLRSAQVAIATNWTTALSRLGLSRVSPAPAPKPAPVPAPAPAPAPASCFPLTSGGNCYVPGEYCRIADRGTRGVAADGRSIICADVNGTWRWEAS